MNIFHNFVSIFGGILGKHILNPEVQKCYEDLITLETNVQQRLTIHKTLTYLAMWGPGGGGGGGQ